mgnify:FL=1
MMAAPTLLVPLPPAFAPAAPAAAAAELLLLAAAKTLPAAPSSAPTPPGASATGPTCDSTATACRHRSLTESSTVGQSAAAQTAFRAAPAASGPGGKKWGLPPAAVAAAASLTIPAIPAAATRVGAGGCEVAAARKASSTA